jgi:hypothetical protein
MWFGVVTLAFDLLFKSINIGIALWNLQLSGAYVFHKHILLKSIFEKIDPKILRKH